MTDQEILQLIFSDPEKLFVLYEKSGGNYEGLKKLKLGKLFAQVRFPEIKEKEYIEAAEFMFWISYFIECEVSNSISEIQVTLGQASKEEIDRNLDDMNFGQKIQFLVDHHYVNDENDPYIVLLRKIKGLRNDMAHGRLHKLEYGGYPLSHPKGQIKLTSDLKNALSKTNNS
jgi:hypothetical protein